MTEAQARVIIRLLLFIARRMAASQGVDEPTEEP